MLERIVIASIIISVIGFSTSFSNALAEQGSTVYRIKDNFFFFQIPLIFYIFWKLKDLEKQIIQEKNKSKKYVKTNT